eukprot:748670-Hanusia_phi.AAC.7
MIGRPIREVPQSVRPLPQRVEGNIVDLQLRRGSDETCLQPWTLTPSRYNRLVIDNHLRSPNRAPADTVPGNFDAV